MSGKKRKNELAKRTSSHEAKNTAIETLPTLTPEQIDGNPAQSWSLPTLAAYAQTWAMGATAAYLRAAHALAIANAKLSQKGGKHEGKWRKWLATTGIGKSKAAEMIAMWRKYEASGDKRRKEIEAADVTTLRRLLLPPPKGGSKSSTTTAATDPQPAESIPVEDLAPADALSYVIEVRNDLARVTPAQIEAMPTPERVRDIAREIIAAATAMLEAAEARLNVRGSDVGGRHTGRTRGRTGFAPAPAQPAHAHA